MRIYLIGYMGSGKSTLCKSIANAMNLEWIDMDSEFESRYKISIQTFFDKYGESVFRDLEHKLLLEISTFPNIVIATGGGLPCYNNNIKLMNQTGITIYLKSEAELVISRLKHTGRNRPIFRMLEGDNIHENIALHIKSREKFYDQAQITIDAKNATAENILSKIENYSGFNPEV